MTEQHNLPAPDEAIRQEYLELVGEIDLCVRELTEGRLSARIGCRPGCADCCMAFSVLPLEAALLAEALVRRSADGGAVARTAAASCGTASAPSMPCGR